MNREKVSRMICILLVASMLLSLNGCAPARVDTSVKVPEDAVCRINLFASSGSYDKTPLIPNLGHSFISVENISGGDIAVGEYILCQGEEITLGVWPISGNFGLWYNLESGLINSSDKYSDRVSVSFLLDRDRLTAVNRLLADEPRWTPLYNCSDFTLDVYNIITGNEYAPPIVTPAALEKIIMRYDYEICREIAENDNIGYYFEGNFEKCELNYR